MEGFAFEVPKLKGFTAWVESYTAHLPSMDWWPTWLNPFNPEHFELTMFLAASTWLLLSVVIEFLSWVYDPNYVRDTEARMAAEAAKGGETKKTR